MQRTMFEIVVLANENINVWRRIEKLVTFEPIDRRDGSLNERMAKRIQNEVARKLEESEDYERRIEQAMGESKTFFFCWTIA
ncbi:putative lamb1 protein [Roseibium sp. TrichSKD4]|nr:putative lamb1 protein [Roseibium sp. TrichSKD4]